MRFYDFLEGVQSRRMVCSRVGGCAAIRRVCSNSVQHFGGCAAFWRRVCSILEGVQHFGGCAVIREGVQSRRRVCSRVGGCAAEKFIKAHGPALLRCIPC